MSKREGKDLRIEDRGSRIAQRSFFYPPSSILYPQFSNRQWFEIENHPL
jgi:hypothetical protein